MLRKAVGKLLQVNTLWSGEISDAEAADTPLYRHPRRVTAADLLPAND